MAMPALQRGGRAPGEAINVSVTAEFAEPAGAVYNSAIRRADSTVDLTHHFLIAMPSMVDPNFAKSLTYICEHNDQGRWA